MRKVALIGYEGAQSLDIAGPMEVFSMANRFGDPRSYEVILASPHGGTILCNSGLALGGSVALADLPGNLDTILVAGGGADALRRASGAPMLRCSLRTPRRPAGSAASARGRSSSPPQGCWTGGGPRRTGTIATRCAASVRR
jgi:transcriptional regulator GlxA family with amidase domain